MRIITNKLFVEPHGFTPVAPPHSSAGETRRSISAFAKATADYPLRIHPRAYVRGFLRRRVKIRDQIKFVVIRI